MKRITIDVDDDFNFTADEVQEAFTKAHGSVFGVQIDDVNFVNHYHHLDCPVRPGVEWVDVWSCKCNDDCPACGVGDIEPYESEEA